MGPWFWPLPSSSWLGPGSCSVYGAKIVQKDTRLGAHTRAPWLGLLKVVLPLKAPSEMDALLAAAEAAGACAAAEALLHGRAAVSYLI